MRGASLGRHSLARHPLVRHYGRLFGDPLLRAFLGDSGYANYGYWRSSTATGKDACDNLVDLLLDRVDGTPDAVLDVACGEGGTTRRLCERWPAARVLALNLASDQLRAARARAPAARFVQADAARLPVRDGCAGVVLCVEAAFHFDTRQAFLRAARAALAPGGWLLLTDVTGRRGGGRIARANRIPDPAAYRALLQRLGFCDVAVDDVTASTWTAFRGRYARFARGPGRRLLLRMLPRLPWLIWLIWRAWVTDRAISAYVTVAAQRPP